MLRDGDGSRWRSRRDSRQKVFAVGQLPVELNAQTTRIVRELIFAGKFNPARVAFVAPRRQWWIAAVPGLLKKLNRERDFIGRNKHIYVPAVLDAEASIGEFGERDTFDKH